MARALPMPAPVCTSATLAPQPGRYKSGGYISVLPLDPWGAAYQYLNPAREATREYDLYTLGADGKAGGEGGDADIYR